MVDWISKDSIGEVLFREIPLSGCEFRQALGLWFGSIPAVAGDFLQNILLIMGLVYLFVVHLLCLFGAKCAQNRLAGYCFLV